MQNHSHSNYYKYAFFSGFTTISTFRQPSEFLEHDIDPLFERHRKALESISQKAGVTEKITDDIVYRPVPYCLFGDFDLAVFSLTDDFGFATKDFKPAPDSQGFKYQVNTGIIPLIETYKRGRDILHIFEHTRLPNFFSGKDFYPFTGIAMIKLNNAMLMGGGRDFMAGMLFFLIAAIDREIDRLDGEGHQLFYIINESLGWNEITINFFGNSMHRMQELLLTLRSKRLHDIITFLREDLTDEEYDKAAIETKIIPLLARTTTGSLLAHLLGDKRENALQSHPVIATSITYGFHAGLSNPGNDLDDFIRGNLKEERYRQVFQLEYDKEIIHIGWKVKPGHEKAADKLIKQAIAAEMAEDMLYKTAQSGKYTFVYPEEQVSVWDYIHFTRNVDPDFRVGMQRNIIKFRSRIQWSSDVTYKPYDEGSHYNYPYERFALDKGTMNEVFDKLRTYPVSNTIRGQIENLIINFNDGVTDPLMYGYFMGLRQSLLKFLKDKFLVGLSKEGDKLGEAESSLDKISAVRFDYTVGTESQEILRKDVSEAENILFFVQNWNKAYWNRYFHSYYFTEITDFNIEHHGGIQQILFTYDAMYKLFARRIYGADSKGAFVNVQGSPIITSTQYYNSINFNHLFRPAIYACECVHEAANHVIPFLVAQKQKKDYKFLVNPSRKVEDDMKAQFRDFEIKIRQHLDARDEFENEYIENNFGINTVRQIVTDYFTYRLAYEKPGNENMDPIPISHNKEAAIRFYQCHWFLFLMNTDLYGCYDDGTGAWFFKEEEFTEIFIRFNLMFYLFYGCTQDELESLNAQCPSIELKPLWDCKKVSLIKFVMRLGDALKKEFENRIEESRGVRGFDRFHADLREAIIGEGWGGLNDKEKTIYKEITEINFYLIEFFYKQFMVKGGDNYNIIIRSSKSEWTNKEEGTGILTNIDFFRNPGKRTIFLDPKGNIFSTSAESRQEIFKRYVFYIKKLWGYALELSLQTFKEEIPAN